MKELLFATVIAATSIENYSRLEELEFRLDFLEFQLGVTLRLFYYKNRTS